MTTVRSEFRIGLKDETRAGIASVNRSLDQLKTRAVALGAGITAGAGLFGAMIKQSANLADELGKTAQKAGVTVESLSALGYAAKLSDIDMGQLSGSLQRLSRLMADAAGGSEEAQKAFSAIGVNVTNAAGQLRSADAVFEDIAEALSKLPDGAQKTAAAMKLFGRSGAEIIPLLNAGRAGLAGYREEAERLGLVLSTETAKAAEEFNDNLARINSALQGFTLQVAGPAIDVLADLSTEYIRAYTEASNFLKVFTSVGSAIARVAYGTDTQRLGKLMNEEMELVRDIDEARRTQWGNMREREIQRMETRLKEVRTELEGLKTVIDPVELGAAPRREPRTAGAQAVVADLGKVSAEAKRVADTLAKESDDVRAYLQDYARDREAMFQREVEQSRARAQALIEQFASPQSKAVKELNEIARLVGDGTATYGEAAIAAFNELNPEIDKTKERAEALRLTFADMGATFQSAFEDAIFSGGKFSDVLKGLAEDVGRILLRKAVIDPIVGAIGNGIGSLFGGGSGGSGGSGPGIGYSIGYLLGQLFANDKGGLYKVAGGGGGERPIAFTAKAGEYVAVGTSMQQGGGGIVVNVIGAPSTPAVRQREVNGRRTLDLVFSSSAASAIDNGMLQQYGMSPALVAR